MLKTKAMTIYGFSLLLEQLGFYHKEISSGASTYHRYKKGTTLLTLIHNYGDSRLTIKQKTKEDNYKIYKTIKKYSVEIHDCVYFKPDDYTEIISIAKDPVIRETKKPPKPYAFKNPTSDTNEFSQSRRKYINSPVNTIKTINYIRIVELLSDLSIEEINIKSPNCWFHIDCNGMSNVVLDIITDLDIFYPYSKLRGKIEDNPKHDRINKFDQEFLIWAVNEEFKNGTT